MQTEMEQSKCVAKAAHGMRLNGMIEPNLVHTSQTFFFVWFRYVENKMRTSWKSTHCFTFCTRTKLNRRTVRVRSESRGKMGHLILFTFLFFCG